MLHYHKDPRGFVTLTIDRPDKLNALSKALRNALFEHCATAQADPQVRVLILTARGKLFTAGLDIDEWQSDELAAGAFERSPRQALAQFDGPIIGAINGPAITGGFEIALLCDVLVASNKASFQDTHAKVGLLPGWGLSVALPAVVGLQRAKQLALSAQVLSAQDALNWGLVSQITTPDELQSASENLATQMLAMEPEALYAYKRLINQGAHLSMQSALENELFVAQQFNARQTREAVLARIHRR
jgi:enoyl-CoA hydratase